MLFKTNKNVLLMNFKNLNHKFTLQLKIYKADKRVSNNNILKKSTNHN